MASEHAPVPHLPSTMASEHAILRKISRNPGVQLNNFFDPLNLEDDGEQDEEVPKFSLVRHRVYRGQTYVHDPSFRPIPAQNPAPAAADPRLPPPPPPPQPQAPAPRLPRPQAGAPGTPTKVSSWVFFLFFLAFLVVWWYYRIIFSI